MTGPTAIAQHVQEDPTPGTISLLVVDRTGVVSDDVWSMLTVRRDLRVVSRLAIGGQMRAVIERRQPDVIIMTWSDADDDPEVLADASPIPCVVVVDRVDALVVARAMRAGARAVISAAMCSTAELATASHAVLHVGGHLSADVADAVATGFREGRLGVVGGDVDRLTRREREIMRLVADGRTNPEIAEALDVSRKTVKNHLTNVYAKLGVNQRAAAVAAWRRAGSTDA